MAVERTMKEYMALRSDTKILKIDIDRWKNASRDKRELSVCRELGMSVAVMAKGEKTGVVEDVDGYEVYRVSTRPIKWMPVRINRLISVFTWAHHARQFHADIISGHDLIALTIGYLSNCFLPKAKRAKLVYDSHEFELGRSAKRNKLTILCIKCLEGFLMRRCAFSIMVNDSIADKVQIVHKLKNRPIVARSIPAYWYIDEAEVAQQRSKFYDALNINKNAFLIIYHGFITKKRGIEQIFRALRNTENVAAIILGNGDEAYLNKLCSLCRMIGVLEKVLFLPAVPLNCLGTYLAAADAGILLGEQCDDWPQSYYLSLPNKFFENIQAKSPMVVGRMPEMEKIINTYQIGITVDIGNVEQAAEAINIMQTDKSFYVRCKENLTRAKEELCWENEKTALKEAYTALMQSIG